MVSSLLRVLAYEEPSATASNGAPNISCPGLVALRLWEVSTGFARCIEMSVCWQLSEERVSRGDAPAKVFLLLVQNCKGQIQGQTQGQILHPIYLVPAEPSAIYSCQRQSAHGLQPAGSRAAANVAIVRRSDPRAHPGVSPTTTASLIANPRTASQPQPGAIPPLFGMRTPKIQRCCWPLFSVSALLATGAAHRLHGDAPAHQCFTSISESQRLAHPPTGASPLPDALSRLYKKA